MNEHTENLPILQDFVPYRGCCPKNEFAIYFDMSLHIIFSGENEREMGKKRQGKRGEDEGGETDYRIEENYRG